MRRLHFTQVLLAAMILISACNKDDDDNGTPQSDQEFMTKAAQGNMAEVDAGQLAAVKGSAGIKMFGSMMVTDHTQAFFDLKAIADSLTYMLPTAPDSVYIKLKQQLSGLSGKSFDSLYINSQVTAHKNTIALFESEASNGYDQRLRNYANKYLPGIRMHLRVADSLRLQIK
jgi:putative membrane protein